MIGITSDSTCDLNRFGEERSIGIMPLNVILDSKLYKDGVDIAPADIFAFVEKTGMLPKTSAPAAAARSLRSEGEAMRRCKVVFERLKDNAPACEIARRIHTKGGSSGKFFPPKWYALRHCGAAPHSKRNTPCRRPFSPRPSRSP